MSALFDEVERLKTNLAAAYAEIERVKAALATIGRLRDKAAEDEDAGYRNAINYADAYDNAARLIREALDPQ